MFEDVAQKIKGFAQILCWLGILGSLIMAMYSCSMAEDSWYVEEEVYQVAAWVWLIVGCLGSYIGSLIMYGFGELIERQQEIAKNTSTKKIENSQEEV